MEKKAKLMICSVVGFLGLLSAVLGFAAEAKRTKGSQVQFIPPYTCIYPNTTSPALGLGLAAAAALLVAQIIIAVTTGCICCKRDFNQPNPNRTLAVVCFVVSWLTFVIAFLLLLTAAALSGGKGQLAEEDPTNNFGYCVIVKSGVFAGAAVLSLACVTLGIVCHLALNPAKDLAGGQYPPPPPNHHHHHQIGIIAMGGRQPQFPPPPNSTEEAPVFVHEDTHMRRQFT